jgi:LAO/AO transport system kinase
MTRSRVSVHDLEQGLRSGDRRMLARAITLVESQRAIDRQDAEELLGRLLPSTGNAYRVGLTGVPGVGKSSFLEALGVRLCDAGRRTAVLAVDPSSAVSGGSILGDKTRMEELSRHPNAFVRPTPGGTALGGVAHRTREALLCCEAAGFDVVFVETIGVGQSETAVAEMVDDFLLLMLAGAGDDLQGIKRGILELADGIAVTKADGDNAERAKHAASELSGALHILRGSGAIPPVQTCSAKTGEGLDSVWAGVQQRIDAARASGSLDGRRSRQALRWFEQLVDESLRARFFGDGRVREALPGLRDAVAEGSLSPAQAARSLLGERRPTS